MDYHFERELGTNKPLARISLEHEGFGEFLSDEIGEDEVKLVQLIRALRPDQHATPSFALVGHQWSLQVDNDAVMLEPHHLHRGGGALFARRKQPERAPGDRGMAARDPETE